MLCCIVVEAVKVDIVAVAINTDCSCLESSAF